MTTELNTVMQQLTELLQRGADADAAALAATARRQFPVAVELIRLHGIALLRLDRRKEALIALNRAVELAPGHVELQCTLANFSLTEGKPDAAIARLRAALAAAPGNPTLLQASGAAFMATGRHVEARDAFAQASQQLPKHPAVRLNLAAAELELGHLPQAEAHLRQVIQWVPESDVAHALLGHLLHRTRRSREAGESLLQAARLAPKNPQHLFQAALVLEEAGDLAAANEAFAGALKRDPSSVPALGQLLFSHRRLCRWSDIDALGERAQQAVARGARGIHPYAFLLEDADAEQQLSCATSFAALVEQQTAAFRQQLQLRYTVAAPKTQIRVGFLADGFDEEETGLPTIALFEALADSELELHLFSTAAGSSIAARKRLPPQIALHDVSSMNRREIATLISRCGIEVMFDLNGYRGSGHVELMALRVAPVQVGWLGYPGSSGAPWMDYLLTDAIALPDSLRPHISEKVVRLPRCHQPIDPTRKRVTPPSRAVCGLPDHGTVFGCFNESYMYSAAVFARCMLILQQVPDSVLWLSSGPADTNQRLRKAAAALDVAPHRLVFMPDLPHSEYLARFANVDLLLDTLPCNARSAAADALWAGCPVLTRSGETMAARNVTSLLHYAGLPELITEDNVTFVGLAVELGNNREALVALRKHLIEQRETSSLFDMQGFANDFRRMVRAISARHRIGRPPTDVDLAEIRHGQASEAGRGQTLRQDHEGVAG